MLGGAEFRHFVRRRTERKWLRIRLLIRVTGNCRSHVVQVTNRHKVMVSDLPSIHYICPPSSPDCSLTFVSDHNMYKASPLLLFSPSRPDIQP